MFISNVAIRRPVFTGMVILALLVFGGISFWGLGRDLFPKIDFPVVTIMTTWRGADPETMETRVADPIEEAVNTLAGMKNLRSTSAEGYCLIVAEFELEKDIDVAYQEVQSRVNSIRGTLPRDIDEPVIQKFDPDSAPIITVLASGDLPARTLYHLADKRVKEQLQRIQGVGAVKIVGGQDRKLWLWIDPVKLKQHGLTVQDVRVALERQHLELPGGRIETGAQELVTRTKAEFQSAAELDELIIYQGPTGVVRLKDLGRAEDGLEELRSYSQYNDQPGLALQVRRQSGANTVQVAEDVKREVEGMRKALAAEGVELKITMDNSAFIKESLFQVEEHLIVGGAFAVITVLLFLLNFRSTFICALVLPTSVLSTFIMMSVVGFSLNFMTLMALMLAIGLLIDDAIVVQENISRHVQEGKPARWAAEFATQEIGLAVMATTFSVVAVFLPTAFTKGIVGRFFFPFGMTVSFAVLISMFVSFTLDPMLSSRLLKKHDKLNPVFARLERAFQALEKVYEKLLGFALGHRWTVVGTAAGLFAVSMYFAGYLRAEFLPEEDRAEFNVMVRTPLGSALDETKKAVEKLRAQLMENKEVEFVFYAIGAGDMQKVNEASLYVRMLPKKQRQTAGLRSQQTLMDKLRTQLAKFPDALVSVQMVDFTGGAGGFKTQKVQYILSGPDLSVLQRISGELLDRLRAREHEKTAVVDGQRTKVMEKDYQDLDTTYEPGKPEASIVINRNRAEELGVSPRDVADTINAGIGGADIGKFKADGERYDIAIRFLEHGRNSLARVEDLEVPSSKGGGVELRNIAHVVRSEVPVEINRYNRQRQITVLANLSQEKILGDAVTEVNRWVEGDAKKGLAPAVPLPAGYRGTWEGEARNMTESSANLGFTMLLSILVIYMVLASQFESLVHPFTIMLSLPLAFVGALLALLAFQFTISIFAQMAFIFLLGLVTKNAILLIDYTNELRERDGLDRTAALKRAGPVRLRPILMTTFAMIFGMLPAAIGTGEGSESRQPMAVAIIGGLVSSTLLTLLVVPVVYSLLDPLSLWFAKKVLKGGEREPAEVKADEKAEEIAV